MVKFSNGKRVYTEAETKMIGKIVHYLSLLGYVKKDGTADNARINEFIQNIGSNNPRKVILPFLFEKELKPIVTQVEARYRNEMARKKKANV
jgi:hypothetical protein